MSFLTVLYIVLITIRLLAFSFSVSCVKCLFVNFTTKEKFPCLVNSKLFQRITQLELNVDLSPDKHTEFIRSPQISFENIWIRNGLEGFEFKQTDQYLKIAPRWKSKQVLDSFFHNRWYAFIKGAICVLGTSNSLSVK